MMPSYNQPQDPRLYDRYDRQDYKYRNHDGYYQDTPSSSYYSSTPPRSNGLAMSDSRPRQRSRQRQRWPPSPSVEDEVVSLSREHSPALPALVDGEPRVRGTKDQSPIILDADPVLAEKQRKQYLKEQAKLDKASLRSRSSTESLGPPTPTELCSQNPERRYVLKSKDGSSIPVEEGYESRRGSYVRTSSTRRQEPPPPIDTNPRRNDQADAHVPERTERQRSPYSYSAPSASSSKSSGRSNYPITSPDLLSPTAQFQSMKDPSGRYQPERQQPVPTGRNRAHSSTSPTLERPPSQRHYSAMGFKGEAQSPTMTRDHSSTYSTSPSSARFSQTPLSARASSSISSKDYLKSPDFSTSDSEVSPNEMAPRRHRRRSSRHSFSSSDRPGETAKLQEAVRRSPKPPLYSPSPVTPLNRPISQQFDNTRRGDDRYVPKSSVSMNATSKRPIPSPRGSPLPSPYSTPPPSPRPDNYNRHSRELPPPPRSTSSRQSSPEGKRRGHQISQSGSSVHSRAHSPNRQSLKTPGILPGRSSRPNSRPASPVSNAPPARKLDLPTDSHIAKAGPAPRSRHTSPLPSPDPSKSNVRIGVEEPTTTPQRASTVPVHFPPRPASREPSTTYVPSVQQSAYLPGLERTNLNLNTTGLATGPPLPRRSFEQAGTPTTPSRPAMPQKVPTSPRLSVTLPPCPRSNYLAGLYDWSTLPGCPDFDCCPACRRAIEHIGFQGQFVPSPHRPTGYQTRCDLAVPWVRMAWLLILQKKNPYAPTILLNGVMDALAKEQPCPGREGAVRNWLRLPDPETGKCVPNFDACPSCVRALEAIFPNLQGTFVQTKSSMGIRRTCDLRTDSARFPKYVDLLEFTSNEAQTYRRPPNMLRFVQLARKCGSMRECQRDDLLLNQPWHFIPELPELTVCEECFDQVVCPQVHNRSELADAFNRKTEQAPPLPHIDSHFIRAGLMSPKLGSGETGVPLVKGTSCQLYSPRMRDLFVKCCKTDDLDGLRKAAVARVMKERELQGRLAAAMRMDEGRRAEEARRVVAEWREWE